MVSSSRGGCVKEIVRSRSHDKRTLQRTCSLRGCSDSFDSQALIVKGTVFVASRILDRASNKSRLGRKPDCLRYDLRRVAKPLFQIRRDGQRSVRHRYIAGSYRNEIRNHLRPCVARALDLSEEAARWLAN